MKVRKVIPGLVVVALLLYGLFEFLKYINPLWVSSQVLVLIIIYLVLTMITAFTNLWAYGKGVLVTVFIASQVIRILLSLGIVYFLIISRPDEANALVINFFITYLFFLIFEIITLLSNLRAEFRKPQ